MLLIFNSRVSREIFVLIAIQLNTSEIYLKFHSYPYYYLYIYVTTGKSDTTRLPKKIVIMLTRSSSARDWSLHDLER